MSKRVRSERRCIESLRKDKEKLEEFLVELREQTEIFELVKRDVIRQIDREKGRVERLIQKVENLTHNTLDHLIWLQERNKIYRENLEREYRGKGVYDPPSLSLSHGLEAIVKTVYGVSMASSPRNFHWEEASFSFLLPCVFPLAIQGDNPGYYLEESVELPPLRNQALKLLEVLDPNSEEYPLEVRDIWVEYLLPVIYGGTDEEWLEGDLLSKSEVKSFMADNSTFPVYDDVMRCIRNEQN